MWLVLAVQPVAYLFGLQMPGGQFPENETPARTVPKRGREASMIDDNFMLADLLGGLLGGLLGWSVAMLR
jgi:hypothetical protein